MRGNDGELSQEDLDKIVKTTKEKWKHPRLCPACGHSNWILGRHLVRADLLAEHITLGGPCVPLVCFFCGNCGNAEFSNAVTMGVLPSPTPPPAGDTNG